MKTAYIGVGANLSQPEQQVRHALEQLAVIEKTCCVQISSLYRSQPWGTISAQPAFINAVAELQTELTAQQLLKACQDVEQAMGRIRDGLRWGPRLIDLDILLYDNLQIQSEALTLPHLHLTEREFVVYPLLEIAPQCRLPDGRGLQEVARQCPLRGLQQLVDNSYSSITESIL